MVTLSVKHPETYISLLEETYQLLSTLPGVCGVPNSGLHEYCWVTNIDANAEETLCKYYCDNDSFCKGYDFEQPGDECAFYTTATCPKTEEVPTKYEPSTKNFKIEKTNAGNVGELVWMSVDNWSGCYKRITGMFHFLLNSLLNLNQSFVYINVKYIV